MITNQRIPFRQKVLALRDQGWTLKALAARYGQYALIRQILADLGRSRKYRLNESALDKLSDEACYIIGAWAGDGCLSSNDDRLSYKVASRDEDLLYRQAEFFGYSGPITHSCFQSALKFKSAKLQAQFIGFGVTPNKTFTVKLSEHVLSNRHTWRGFADADGTLGFGTEDKRRPNATMRPFFGFTKGSQAIIIQAAEYIRDVLGIGGRIRFDHGGWRIDYYDRKAETIIYHLYHDAPIALERKLNRAQQMLYPTKLTSG